MPTVVVIGGGISGLACARHIADRRPDVDVHLLEASDRLGGAIHTDSTDGWVCEAGPGSFVDRNPSTRRLIERLDLADDVVAAGNAIRRRYIRHEGRLHRFPDSPQSLAKTALLTKQGRARMLLAPVRPDPGRDWTVSQFATAQLGKEAATMLLDPIVGGIYAGDAAVLSARSVLPQLVSLADRGGRVCDALLGQGQGRLGKGSMVTLGAGLGQLISSLEKSLGDRVQTQAPVTRIRRTDGAWMVNIGGERPRSLLADAIVVTLHGQPATRLLGPLHADLDTHLRAVPVAPVCVVHLGFEPNVVAHPLDGFGYLIPSTEGGHVLGVKWTTSIFPQGRAPEGHTLMQVFVGGARNPDIARDPERCLEAARFEVSQTLGITVPPAHVRTFSHPVGIPQYHVGHADRVNSVEAAIGSLPGLYLAGTSLHGVGINAATTESEKVAEGVASFLPQSAQAALPLFA